MKFALASDLHLHFGAYVPVNKEKADCLILAGDIYEVKNLPEKENETHYVRTFFRECAEQFKDVIWVAGNHESYGSNLYNLKKSIADWLKDDKNLVSNVHFLEKNSIVLGDVNIHGTTLWTSLKNNDPIVGQQAFRGMNDFSQIEDMSLSKWFIEFQDSVNFLGKSVIKGEKNLVVTHHHPSMLGISKEFKNSTLNYAYASDLSEFIYEHPDINVWCCGHVHDKSDYMLYNTKVLCNPRGYKGYETISNNFELVYFDL